MVKASPVRGISCINKLKTFFLEFVSPPCEAATGPEQIHKGHADESVHVQDQVGFLRQKRNNSADGNVLNTQNNPYY